MKELATHFWEKLILILIIIMIVFVFGFVMGHYTCAPKPSPATVTTTPVQPSPQPATGILTPIPPTPSISVSPISPSSDSLVWYQFTDVYLDLRVRAILADTIQYTLKKHWHEFKPAPPGLSACKVYGIAPESVVVTIQPPAPLRTPGIKNFSLILTATTLPSGNILLGYKNIIIHIQYAPGPAPAGEPQRWSFSYGLGYYLKF